MMFERMPYFMTNTDWFVETHNGWSWKLTDKAPQKAVASFKEWVKSKVQDDEIEEEVKKMEKRLGLK